MRWALLLVVLVGCGYQAEPCPERYESRILVEAAWVTAFPPEDRGPCPCVSWVRRFQLDCVRTGPEAGDWHEVPKGTGDGWVAGDTTFGRTCVVGLSHVEDNRMWAITPDDLAHEMVHHWLFRHSGDGDGFHRSPHWRHGYNAARAAVAFYQVKAPSP